VTPDELLALYDAEVRGTFADRLPPGWSSDQDGPVTRALTPRGGFAMITADADGLGAGEFADLVDRTVGYYRRLGRAFEWKTFDHDRGELRPLLLERGAVAEPREALVLGEAAPLATEPVLPSGLTLRSVTSPADLARVAELESEVWNEDRSWLADDLADRLAGPDPVDILVVEDGDVVVSAAWLVPLTGTSVAGLWGGSTLAGYRGRGIYRALVARRARLALDRGFTVLQVDASEDSRPILQRLGLQVVGGTVPYVLEPL
jgi:GNAT superfamily N-acetyltransferase